jgi:hypothetical protein
MPTEVRVLPTKDANFCRPWPNFCLLWPTEVLCFRGVLSTGTSFEEF